MAGLQPALGVCTQYFLFSQLFFMAKDLAYEKELSVDPKKSIRKGFVWLGIASVISQILSAVTMIIAMIFMTKEEIGVATLALSFIAIVESFNALGTHQGILQAKTLTPDETHSTFWFASFFGLIILVLTIPFAWLVAWIYNNDALVPLFITSMIKMPIVCIAAVPFQMINRRFEYQKISAVNTLTILTCSILKILLAILGFGAWAFVISDTSYGVGTLIGAFVCSKYRPKMHFKWSECVRFVKFGIKMCLSTCVNQFNKNLHFLVVGKLLGEGVLGIYKIAYELAMTPALSLFVVVTRSSFPVFSRLQDKRDELSKLFLWNQKNIAILAAIPAAAILFIAIDIFGLMPREEWLAATPVIPFLLVLSFFRSILLAYPDLYRASGRPDYPIYTEVLEAVLFVLVCAGSLYLCNTYWNSAYAIETMISSWVALHLVYFIIHCRISQNFIDNSLKKIVLNMFPGLGYILFASVLSIPLYLFRDSLPWTNWTHLIAELLVIVISLLLYSKYILKVSLRDLVKKKKSS